MKFLNFVIGFPSAAGDLGVDLEQYEFLNIKREGPAALESGLEIERQVRAHAEKEGLQEPILGDGEARQLMMSVSISFNLSDSFTDSLTW